MVTADQSLDLERKKKNQLPVFGKTPTVGFKPWLKLVLKIFKYIFKIKIGGHQFKIKSS